METLRRRTRRGLKRKPSTKAHKETRRFFLLFVFLCAPLWMVFFVRLCGWFSEERGIACSRPQWPGVEKNPDSIDRVSRWDEELMALTASLQISPKTFDRHEIWRHSLIN